MPAGPLKPCRWDLQVCESFILQTHGSGAYETTGFWRESHSIAPVRNP